MPHRAAGEARRRLRPPSVLDHLKREEQEGDQGREGEGGQEDSRFDGSSVSFSDELEDTESDSGSSFSEADVTNASDLSSSSSGCSSGTEDVEDHFFSDSSRSSDASCRRKVPEKPATGTDAASPSSGSLSHSSSISVVYPSTSFSPSSPSPSASSRPHSPSSSSHLSSSSRSPFSSPSAGSSSPSCASAGSSAASPDRVASPTLDPASPRTSDWTEKQWWGGGMTRGIPANSFLAAYPSRLCGVALPPFEELSPHWRELGALAFWRLSSAKDGSGVAQLRDNDSRTFWQSDGAAPHTVTLTFNRLMKISRVDLLLNLQVDESYTPRVVQIKIGDSPTTLHVAKEAEYEPGARDEGAAWWSILLHPKDALRAKHAGRLPFEDAPDEALSPFYAWLDTLDYVGGFCLQIAILQTFHEGRDVHVRQIRVYGPDGEARPAVSPAHECSSRLVHRGQGRGATETDANEGGDQALVSFESLPSFHTAQMRFPHTTSDPLDAGESDQGEAGGDPEEEPEREQAEEQPGEQEGEEEPRDVAFYLVRMYYETQLRRQREDGDGEERNDAAVLPTPSHLSSDLDSGTTAGMMSSPAGGASAGHPRDGSGLP
ncbi:anaphase-promoting complex subunit APC10 [Toxoplasma gondii ARI]|uniref:Anaphase-promoting complex subunit APC10 n=1 Tax=Toxoplasma gondii ARI TaxID=1074872 RepID=A0A139XZW2_TOXGO|nr:anaphase-promoting complex subunit APC10 [Toxoplasma gondii ARI]